MKNKEKQEFINDVQQLQQCMNSNNEEYGDLKDIFQVEWFYNLTSSHTNLLIKVIARLYKIEFEAMNWFIYDNDFGNKQMQCKKTGKNRLVKIKNASDFWNFEKNSK